ncbi:unnamed protein product [Clonostachys chloroleuca]|uniref:Uncharacterized protein n=1 Tax=Clonostachys chloroleuca TaxID=1926264 RepID=A0AA35Q0A9_9HYPO|nr:unnamed protein product [Clonostachys chloroleuca]
MGSRLSQVWPPAPKFTERDVPDQSGKVFIITGASSGVGKELARLVFALNAKVYLASRSESKVRKAISDIQTENRDSKGELEFLQIDLEDLESVKQAAQSFLRMEKRLDMLWNNAGVMLPPSGSKTKQGYDMQLGVNCLAPFLFTQLLTPIMKETAKGAKTGSVRVLWVSSSAAELFSPTGGVDLDNLDYKKPQSNHVRYAISKAGMVLLAQEYAKRHHEDGIISVAMNPGNLKSELQRHVSGIVTKVFHAMSWEPIYGAYTELYSAFSPDITVQNSGCWVIPWGRLAPVRKDIREAGMGVSEGGTGNGEKFWLWSVNELHAHEAE